MTKEVATLAMGCFWKPDLLFTNMKGVIKAEVGYMGGNEKKYPNPSYEDVCTNKTGYAEVVQITFDNKKISYEEILEAFWKNHNPTSKNRQGLDFGTQYRSEIFYHSEEQKTKATKSKKQAQKNYKKKIVTKITKAKTFYKAEEYHQKYLEKRGLETCGI